ncbi:hypothetical protein [Bosea minatitlanensis]|uniref:Uncharacterized protein n=1 Tax=Bosea minatitlanensis TaxID=128782 RepID=A0ABW0F3P1_9HYPH|nr:hypothetical protein [Bosea minatitlanensis]MCT4495274.1 hypothetical protein [Bosea minatitlanensis]
MRIISQTSKRFHGTHKGYEISIWLDEDDLEEDEVPRFYIQVWSLKTGGHNYDGWAPESVTTIAEAKKEAIRGSCIDMPKSWWANLGKPSAETAL